jgi:hypothetical protein
MAALCVVDEHDLPYAGEHDVQGRTGVRLWRKKHQDSGRVQERDF